MNFSEMYPSKYLKQSDVTSPMTASIASIVHEELTGDKGKKTKPILYFHGNVKPMVLNLTNGQVLYEAFGQDTDAWINKAVEIYSDPNIMMGPKRVGGLRLRVAPSRNGNGFQTTSGWSWDQALVEAGKVGIDKDKVIQELKAAGKQGWNAAGCTPLVKKMIEDATVAGLPDTNFDADPVAAGSDDIPF